jgi:hypothetical protein
LQTSSIQPRYIFSRSSGTMLASPFVLIKRSLSSFFALKWYRDPYHLHIAALILP